MAYNNTSTGFSSFSCMFLNFNCFFSLNSNCSNILDLRNLQKKVKKAFCYQKLFWPSTVWINCSSDLKIFENSRPSASNFKSYSRSLENFFLKMGQNNFGDKIPQLPKQLDQMLPDRFEFIRSFSHKISCSPVGRIATSWRGTKHERIHAPLSRCSFLSATPACLHISSSSLSSSPL